MALRRAKRPATSKGGKKAKRPSSSYGRKRKAGVKARKGRQTTIKAIVEDTIERRLAQHEGTSLVRFTVLGTLSNGAGRTVEVQTGRNVGHYNYMRMPISQVIPPKEGAISSSGMTFVGPTRLSNSVEIRGVRVRFEMQFSMAMEVVAVCRRVPEPMDYLRASRADGLTAPDKFVLDPDGDNPGRLLTGEAASLYGRKGPFAPGNHMETMGMLDSPDGSAFHARVNNDPAHAPIGQWGWKVDGYTHKNRVFSGNFCTRGGTMRTQNWGNIQGGFVQNDTENVDIFLHMKQGVEFMDQSYYAKGESKDCESPMMPNMLSDWQKGHYEVLLGVRARGDAMACEEGALPVTAARVGNVSLDIYYRNVNNGYQK